MVTRMEKDISRGGNRCRAIGWKWYWIRNRIVFAKFRSGIISSRSDERETGGTLIAPVRWSVANESARLCSRLSVLWLCMLDELLFLAFLKRRWETETSERRHLGNTNRLRYAPRSQTRRNYSGDLPLFDLGKREKLFSFMSHDQGVRRVQEHFLLWTLKTLKIVTLHLESANGQIFDDWG